METWLKTMEMKNQTNKNNMPQSPGFETSSQCHDQVICELTLFKGESGCNL
jgi:hypothetical protein